MNIPHEAFEETAVELLTGAFGFAVFVVGSVLLLWALRRCMLWAMTLPNRKSFLTIGAVALVATVSFSPVRPLRTSPQ